MLGEVEWLCGIGGWRCTRVVDGMEVMDVDDGDGRREEPPGVRHLEI